MNSDQINTLKQQYGYFPDDVPINLPERSNLPQEDQHFLLFIPWKEEYLKLIPLEFQKFYKEILPLLSVRTTDVHTAVCLQYLDEFIQKAKEQGKIVNRNIVAYALMLHDCGWGEMSEEEIAASLGVKGLRLNETSLGPKEKHAVLGEKIARKILTAKKDTLFLSDAEIDIICRAILYHDKPEEIRDLANEIPIEMQLLVDLDHIWSFTHLNFWQDTIRKCIAPKQYVENLGRDLNSYFVTEIGKAKASELLVQRAMEVDRV